MKKIILLQRMSKSLVQPDVNFFRVAHPVHPPDHQNSAEYVV